MQWLKQSTSVTLKIGPFLDEDDGKTAETGLTIAQADVRLSKNGGDIAQKNEATSCTHDELGIYGCPVDTTDTNTLGRLQLWVHESGALPVWHEFMVVPANIWDSMFGADMLKVDVHAIDDDETAADNAEAFFDGTGYAGTNNVIPTVSALTGHTAQTGDNYARLGAPAGASVSADIADVPTVAEFEARTLVTASYFDPAADAVANVTLVATTTTNTDVRGTDSAALASVCTEARLAELDAANLPTDIAALPTTAEVNAEVDTALVDIHLDHLLATDYDPASKPGTATALLNELVESDAGISRFTENALEQAPSGTGASAATIADAVWDEAAADHVAGGSFGVQAGTDIDAILADTNELQTDDIPGAISALNNISTAQVNTEVDTALSDYDGPTNAEMEARTLVAASYFDPTADAVANVTLVATTTTNTDMVGTDSAALASVCTETRLAELAAANLPTDIDAILADTGTDGVLLAAAATSAQLVDDTWDEPLTGATHNVATSAGRRLRALAAQTIRDETAQAGSATTITLDAGANAIDGMYVGDVIVIVGGTGIDQSRVIVDYNGTSKVATIGTGWLTTPDDTSEFIILAVADIDHTTHGVAQAGASGTITMASDASAVDDYYNDQMIHLVTGTGEGQVRLISDYNGTSKVASITPNWATAPDDTSIYHTGIAARCDAGLVEGLDATDQINAACDTALSDYDPATHAELVSEIDAVQTDIAALNDLSTAQVNAECDTALSDYDAPTKAELDTGLAALNDIAVTDITQRQIPDSVPADGTLPTIEQSLYMITQFLYERAVSGTTVTVKKADGSTSLLTLTLDDGADPTSITRAT